MQCEPVKPSSSNSQSKNVRFSSPGREPRNIRLDTAVETPSRKRQMIEPSYVEKERYGGNFMRKCASFAQTPAYSCAITLTRAWTTPLCKWQFSAFVAQFYTRLISNRDSHTNLKIPDLKRRDAKKKLKGAAHLIKSDTTPPLRGCVVYVAAAFFIFSRVTLYTSQSYSFQKKLHVLILKLFSCGSVS